MEHPARLVINAKWDEKPPGAPPAARTRDIERQVGRARPRPAPRVAPPRPPAPFTHLPGPHAAALPRHPTLLLPLPRPPAARRRRLQGPRGPHARGAPEHDRGLQGVAAARRLHPLGQHLVSGRPAGGRGAVGSKGNRGPAAAPRPPPQARARGRPVLQFLLPPRLANPAAPYSWPWPPERRPADRCAAHPIPQGAQERAGPGEEGAAAAAALGEAGKQVAVRCAAHHSAAPPACCAGAGGSSHAGRASPLLRRSRCDAQVHMQPGSMHGQHPSLMEGSDTPAMSNNGGNSCLTSDHGKRAHTRAGGIPGRVGKWP